MPCCKGQGSGHAPDCVHYEDSERRKQKRLTAKDTNPKDAVGTGKVPLSTVPAQVVAEIGLAMLEGARKYGRHNYRIAGVRASVYYDAAMRHMMAWYEGQDIDPDSGLPHVVKALASLTVLRDAQINDKCTDDRPPSMTDVNWVAGLNKTAGDIIARYPEPKEAYTRAIERDLKVDALGVHEVITLEMSKGNAGAIDVSGRADQDERWENDGTYKQARYSGGKLIGWKLIKPGAEYYKYPPTVEHCTHGVNVNRFCDECAQNRHIG